MVKVYLLNGGKVFCYSGGRLSDTLHNHAKETLKSMGHEVREVKIDSGYDINKEIENILWADVLIYQIPGWWMGEPWTVKKYIDEVFTAGDGKFFTSDGRTRSDPSKRYGTGGLLHGKSVMISTTWNAPDEAFDVKGGLFEGVGIDMVFMHLYKAHRFIGIKALPTYIATDVVKNTQVEKYKKDYADHLKKHIK